eukprot:UN34456
MKINKKARKKQNKEKQKIPTKQNNLYRIINKDGLKLRANNSLDVNCIGELPFNDIIKLLAYESKNNLACTKLE